MVNFWEKSLTALSLACIISRTCLVFEPGEAHMSKILWWGCTSNKNTGIMLTSSCLEIFPHSLSLQINSCIPVVELRSSQRLSLCWNTPLAHGFSVTSFLWLSFKMFLNLTVVFFLSRQEKIYRMDKYHSKYCSLN